MLQCRCGPAGGAVRPRESARWRRSAASLRSSAGVVLGRVNGEESRLCLPSGLAGSIRSFQGASLKRILEARAVGVKRRGFSYRQRAAEKLVLEWDGMGGGWWRRDLSEAGRLSSTEPEELC